MLRKVISNIELALDTDIADSDAVDALQKQQSDGHHTVVKVRLCLIYNLNT